MTLKFFSNITLRSFFLQQKKIIGWISSPSAFSLSSILISKRCVEKRYWYFLQKFNTSHKLANFLFPRWSASTQAIFSWMASNLFNSAEQDNNQTQYCWWVVYMRGAETLWPFATEKLFWMTREPHADEDTLIYVWKDTWTIRAPSAFITQRYYSVCSSAHTESSRSQPLLIF